MKEFESSQDSSNILLQHMHVETTTEEGCLKRTWKTVSYLLIIIIQVLNTGAPEATAAIPTFNEVKLRMTSEEKKKYLELTGSPGEDLPVVESIERIDVEVMSCRPGVLMVVYSFDRFQNTQILTWARHL